MLNLLRLKYEFKSDLDFFEIRQALKRNKISQIIVDQARFDKIVLQIDTSDLQRDDIVLHYLHVEIYPDMENETGSIFRIKAKELFLGISYVIVSAVMISLAINLQVNNWIALILWVLLIIGTYLINKSILKTRKTRMFQLLNLLLVNYRKQKKEKD